VREASIRGKGENQDKCKFGKRENSERRINWRREKLVQKRKPGVWETQWMAEKQGKREKSKRRI